MFDFVSDFFSALTWSKVLIGAAIFLVSFFANLGIVTGPTAQLPVEFTKYLLIEAAPVAQ